MEFIVAYLFVNALLALPVAYVASEKGRSGSGFFFLSFFFSFIVGILVVLALPRVESQSIAVESSGSFAREGSERLFKCQNCAEWVKAEAKVCRFCGKDIAKDIELMAEKEKIRDEEQAKLPVGSRICPSCRSVYQNQVACSDCDEWLVAPQ
jgi:hypothetical protein